MSLCSNSLTGSWCKLTEGKVNSIHLWFTFFWAISSYGILFQTFCEHRTCRLPLEFHKNVFEPDDMDLGVKHILHICLCAPTPLLDPYHAIQEVRVITIPLYGYLFHDYNLRWDSISNLLLKYNL